MTCRPKPTPASTRTLHPRACRAATWRARAMPRSPFQACIETRTTVRPCQPVPSRGAAAARPGERPHGSPVGAAARRHVGASGPSPTERERQSACGSSRSIARNTARSCRNSRRSSRDDVQVLPLPRRRVGGEVHRADHHQRPRPGRVREIVTNLACWLPVVPRQEAVADLHEAVPAGCRCRARAAGCGPTSTARSGRRRRPAPRRRGGARAAGPGRSTASRRSTPRAGPSHPGRRGRSARSMCRTSAYCSASEPNGSLNSARCPGDAAGSRRRRRAAAGGAGRSSPGWLATEPPSSSAGPTERSGEPGDHGYSENGCGRALLHRSAGRRGACGRTASGHRHTFTRPWFTPCSIGSPVPSTRNRYRLLAGALLCLLVVVAFAVLYKADVSGLDELRQRPRVGSAGLDLPAPGRAALLPVRPGGVHDGADDDLHGRHRRPAGLAQARRGPPSGRSS